MKRRTGSGAEAPGGGGTPRRWWRRLAASLAQAAAAALIFGLAGSLALRRGWFAPLDSLRLAAEGEGWLTRFFLAVTWFGTTEGVALTSLLMLGLLLLQRRWEPALAFVAAALTAALANDGLKDWIGRERPPTAGLLAEAPGFSFPSGHAFVCTAVYGLFGWFLVRRLRAGWARAAVGAAFAVALALIGFSRLYLGVHYPSDVLAGWVLGAVWLAIFARAAGPEAGPDAPAR